MLRTFNHSHKGIMMDEFTFGMFGEMDDYNAREEVREFDEWHQMMDGDEPDDFAADYYGEQDFG